MSRFDAQPALELIASAYWFETQDAPLLHHDLTLSDLAHLLHLEEKKLIPRDDARELLRLLLELDGDASFAYEPRYGDAFTNREHWLQARAPQTAGYYSTGRARREATTVAFRLLVRREILRLADELIELEDALLDLAARHVETLMPDYTYLQQAQPTTLAHYLLSFLFPLRRDFTRLREAFAPVNQSPAGIGSTNGARLPIERERLAELLGFDGVIMHTRDAMWQADVPIQTMNAAATLMVQLDRLAEDLQIFNTTEFGFVESADDLARASVVMPQKKNPYPLAFVRGAAGLMIGRVAETYAIARTPSAQADNRIMAHGEVPRALDLATRGVRLMASVIKSLVIHPEKMERGVMEGFTQATDLAEALVVTAQIDYRTAHQLVGRVVQELVKENKSARDITPARLDGAAREIIGRPLGIAAADIADALDPVKGIAARAGTGGAAPVRVREMIEECRLDVKGQRAWAEETKARLESAEKGLVEQAKRAAESREQ